MNEEEIFGFYLALQKQLPTPVPELNFSSPFELLIAVILSAQATDISVNKATDQLFKLANTPEMLLNLGIERIESCIRSIGLYRTKAKNIIKTCEQLLSQHNGHVPNTRDTLENLAGVGRKTANVVLNTAFKQPVIAVDTHIFRVSNRTKLAEGKTVLAVEKTLMQRTPREFLLNAHHWLILHGRYICTARITHCDRCCTYEFCKYPDKRPQTHA